MRRVGFVALFIVTGASCATVDSNRNTPVAGATPAESHFRLAEMRPAETKGPPSPPAPPRATTAQTQPASPAMDDWLTAASSDGVVRLDEALSHPAGAEGDVFPAAFDDLPVPPGPSPDGTGANAIALPAAGPGLTLDQAIHMAFAANPTIAEAEYSVRRSQGEWTQTGLKPNPTVYYIASEVGNEDQPGQQGVYVQQSIPTGNKLELNRAVASGDVSSARAEAEAQRLRVRTDVQARFYGALGAQRLVQIAEQTEQNAQKSLDATRRLQEAGESTRADVLLAEAIFQRSGVSRQEAEARARGEWRRLAAMLGSPDLPPQPLVGALDTERRPDEFEMIWMRLRATSPELRRASARIARARARIGRERAQNVPDIDAQLALQQDTATDYTLGYAQIGIMLPVHQRNQGAIAAAHAEYCREIKEYERLELNLRDRLAQSVRDAEVAAQQVETYGQKVVPASEEGLGLIREGYARGEFDVLRLVSAQQTYADALREYVQAQIDLQTSLASLDGLLLSGGLDEPGQPQGVGTPDTLIDVPKAQ